MNVMSEHVQVELDGNVAVVTMAKPPHNLLNGEFIDGLIADSPWAEERGIIREIEDRAGGTARVPGPPWRFGASTLPDAGLAPFQGEHNTEVLRSLGLDDEAIAVLAAKSVIVDKVPAPPD